MNLRRYSQQLWLLALVVLLGAALQARAEEDWNPEEALPQFTYARSVAPSERAASEELRRQMIESLKYWKARGLPKPPVIESLIYIPTYQGVRVNELLQSLNPGLPDVKGHVAAQFEHFRSSDLYLILSTLEERTGQPEGTLTNRFFDNYAHIRYGFAVSNFYVNVMRNSRVDKIPTEGDDDRPTDNAYYARYPRIDLTDVLPVHTPRKQLSMLLLNILNGAPDEAVLSQLVGASGKKLEIARRIVFLPRRTEMPGTSDISTLNDFSVAKHELGHHMNATVSEKTGGVPRMVDEAMADYLAASQADDPLIGAFFAKASGEIARRLKQDPDPDAQRAAKQMSRMAAKGALRDMRDVVSIDEIGRSIVQADDYSAGHPIRAFLWTLRNRSSLDVTRVDEVALKAVSELSAVPMIMTEQALEQIHLRKFMRDMQKLVQVQERLKDMVIATGRRVFTRAEFEELKKQAKEMVTQELQDREKEAKEMRMLRIREGNLARRPLVTADYVVPEFFRAFYRSALALRYDDVADAVIKSSAAIMNSEAAPLELSNGKKELVFYRKPGLVNDGTVKAKLLALFEIRMRVKDTLDKLPDDLPVEKAEEILEPLIKDYGDSLNRVVAFERTGLESRLDDPRLHDKAIDHLAKMLQASCGKGFRGLNAVVRN